SFTERARLRQLGDELDALGRRGLGNSPEYLEVDVAFHRLLLEASGNAMLAQLAVPVEEVLRGRAALGLTPAMPAEGTLENHVATAAAISASDADAAEAGARTYVTLIAREVGDAARGEHPREAG
ncbi:FCD domain-containing protein, partial [uncultured Schumannella sp.]|uniref:FCD domain-containing protein n=1 Tax=uncultured Schumannella sp. TaxID=1195956 RepID=UPI0025F243DB